MVGAHYRGGLIERGLNRAFAAVYLCEKGLPSIPWSQSNRVKKSKQLLLLCSVINTIVPNIFDWTGNIKPANGKGFLSVQSRRQEQTCSSAFAPHFTNVTISMILITGNKIEFKWHSIVISFLTT